MEIAKTISWNYIDFKSLRKVIGFFSRPYFGVGTRGQFESELTINDEPYRCVSDDFVLPLQQCSHIAAVVKAGDGLYLDGKPAGFTPLKKTFRQAKDTELRVGQNYTAVKDLEPDRGPRNQALLVHRGRHPGRGLGVRRDAVRRSIVPAEKPTRSPCSNHTKPKHPPMSQNRCQNASAR